MVSPQTDMVLSKLNAVMTDQEVRRVLESALSANTIKAYRKDLDAYKAAGGTIPADVGNLCVYLIECTPYLTMATIQRRLVSIGRAHALAGHADPTKAAEIKMVMRGLKRQYGKPQRQVAAAVKDDIVSMLAHMPKNLKGTRDAALLLIGFCGALRRSELCVVRVEDLEFTNEGLILTVPRSKTDQTGQGRKIGIPKGKGRICPVAAMQDWLSMSGIENGHVFRAVGKGSRLQSGALNDRSIAQIIKHYAAKAGLKAERYSGHSLRSGLATSAAQAGIASHIIRRQTGHKSDAMLARYIRDGDMFTQNAAGLF